MRPRYLLPIVATWTTGCLTVAGLDKDFTGDLGKSSAKAGAAGNVAQAGAGSGGGDAGNTSTGGAGQSGGAGGTSGGGAGQSGGGAGGAVGGAGSGGAGTGGAGGQAGKAGSQALGGAAAVCPITSFNGLPLCAETGPYPCPECVCNDIAAASSCGAKYKACLNDTACSQTIECLLRQCSLEECAPLSTGNMAIVMDFLGCMTGVCAAKCM